MFGSLLAENTKITKIKDYQAAGTSDITSDEIDMQGWTGVLILVSYVTPAANNLFHVEASTTTSGTFADIEGSEMDLEGASDEDQVQDIYKPPRRFLVVVAQCGTSSALEGIWAIQYGPTKPPQDDTLAGTLVQQSLVQPAIGTT